MLKSKMISTVMLLGCLTFSALSHAKLTVFAAASMSSVLEEIRTSYLKHHPHSEIDFSFASSSVLARQISQGAPADLFISANQKWMDFLAEKEAIIPESRSNLVMNTLVMIAPKDSKIEKIDVKDAQWHKLLSGSYLAVGDPSHVPAGKYAQEALSTLGQWHELETKLARANNVRAALALIEQGESPLGIVYGTDAKVSKKVKVVATFPDDSHSPIEYPIAVVKGHSSQENTDFLIYLKSAEATQIFQKFGFSVK